MIGSTHSKHTSLMPKIYYGNVTTNGASVPLEYQFIEVTDSKVIFTGYPLSANGGFTKKLDLLFYNRVNAIGEVLSSLVYISDALALSDVSEKEYDFRTLYRNTDLERGFDLEGVTDFAFLNYKWATSKYYTSTISPLSKYAYEEMNVAGVPSVTMSKYGTCFDGWYTQMSVGLKSNTSITSPAKNVIAYFNSPSKGLWPAVHKSSNTEETAETYWDLCDEFHTGETVFNPDGSIKALGAQMAAVITSTSSDNVYIKQELFILPTYIELYKSNTVKYAEEANYGNPYPILRNKHRIMNLFADNGQIDDAQFVLQSTEYFCATAR